MDLLENSFHGSDVETIASRYQISKNDIIPYASNVNPLGISPMAKDALLQNIDKISTYPDRDYNTLKTFISQYCKVETDNIILGNGVSDLIRVVFNIAKPKKTWIVGPAYSEYSRSAKLAGSEVEMYMLKELDDFEMNVDTFTNALDESIDMLVICNPNNPTGKSLTVDEMDTILAACKALNIFVMIDETYVEFVKKVDTVSSVSLVNKYDNFIVLRGVSKFFSAPGLRFGYAVTGNQEFLEKSSNDVIPWNISTFASVAGVMFADSHYINLTSSLIQTERNLIYMAMSSRKTIKVYKPSANFILIKLLKEDQTAADVFEYCLNRGFMIRDCSDYEGLGNKYVRFCFMKPEQNDQMVNTILEIV